jgi:hypothetical protein
MMIKTMTMTKKKMKQRLLSIALACLSFLLLPVTAMAQDEEPDYYDARLEGYPQGVTLERSTTALTWLLFIFLAVICIAVLFKNAKRTHLD